MRRALQIEEATLSPHDMRMADTIHLLAQCIKKAGEDCIRLSNVTQCLPLASAMVPDDRKFPWKYSHLTIVGACIHLTYRLLFAQIGVNPTTVTSPQKNADE